MPEVNLNWLNTAWVHCKNNTQGKFAYTEPNEKQKKPVTHFVYLSLSIVKASRKSAYNYIYPCGDFCLCYIFFTENRNASKHKNIFTSGKWSDSLSRGCSDLFCDSCNVFSGWGKYVITDILYRRSTSTIVTDTLAVTDNGEPLSFVSKAGYIPQLRTIIAGTGAGGFSNTWLLEASTRMVVSGIQNLNYHTSACLRRLWKQYKHDHAIPSSSTVTTSVYQFAICEETGNIVSFAYRSVHDFESEQLQYGTGVKPECQILDGDLLQTIPVMMNEQRAIQATYPHPERIHIGGEMIAHYLTSSMYQCFKIGEFEDFRTQGEYILSRI